MAQKVLCPPTSRNPNMSPNKKNHSTRPGLAKTTGKVRVLNLDDNTALRELMADVPALEGFQLKAAHTVLRAKSRRVGQQ